MRQLLRVVIIVCLAISLTACGSVTLEPTATSLPTQTFTPSPTSTPIPTATSTPTATPTPTMTPTPKPTNTFTPSPTATKILPTATKTFTPEPVTPTIAALPLPTGAPASSWRGIPIMPNAISGGEEQDVYSYIVKATVKQVQDFYDREMPEVDWQPFATGTGETGNLLLMYQKDSKITTIGVIKQGDVTYVMIVQS